METAIISVSQRPNVTIFLVSVMFILPPKVKQEVNSQRFTAILSLLCYPQYFYNNPMFAGKKKKKRGGREEGRTEGRQAGSFFVG